MSFSSDAWARNAALYEKTRDMPFNRELASGLSAPIGFKNGTDGSIGIATDAMRSAAQAPIWCSRKPTDASSSAVIAPAPSANWCCC